MSETIDTADHVKHGPSGETWVVAFVQDDKLSWCGWPEGSAELSDCTLTKKATDEERLDLLQRLEFIQDASDSRQRYAAQRLAEVPIDKWEERRDQYHCLFADR